LARFNRVHYWLITQASWWIAAVAGVYLAGAAILGWNAAFEVLTGITAPQATKTPAIAYVLSLFGWLLVPALVGAAAGYLVTRQIDSRRSRSIEDIIAIMEQQADGPGPPDPQGGE